MNIPHSQIQVKAYELWEQAGRPEGQADEHWFEAEKQLNQPKKKATTQPAEKAKQK